MLAKAELNYYPEEVLEKEYIEKRQNNKQKRVKKNKNNKNNKNKGKSLFKLTCFVSVILLMITGLYVLLGYANITKMRMEVTQLEKEKIELEKMKNDLAADLEGVKNSLKISEDAMYKLGMTYPQEGQIVYVSVDDFIEDPADNIGISKPLEKVVSIFSSLF